MTINTRDLDFLSANVKVRYRKNGTMIEKTAAEIIANAGSEQTDIQAILGLSAATVKTVKTAYVTSNGKVQDTDGNDYIGTWTAGKAIDYTTVDYNSCFLKDVTV